MSVSQGNLVVTYPAGSPRVGIRRPILRDRRCRHLQRDAWLEWRVAIPQTFQPFARATLSAAPRLVPEGIRLFELSFSLECKSLHPVGAAGLVRDKGHHWSPRVTGDIDLPKHPMR